MTWLVSVFLNSRKYFDIIKIMIEQFNGQARKAMGQVARKATASQPSEI